MITARSRTMWRSIAIGCALLLSLTSLGLAQQEEAPDPNEPVGNNAFRIVSPAWLADHLDDPNLVILDVRPDVHDYLAGHIPNATYISDGAFRVPEQGIPVQYLEPEPMTDLFRSAGVNDNSQIVIYSDGEDVLGATMVAYAFNRIGRNDAMVLDGGFQGWKRNQDVTQEYPKYSEGNLRTRHNRDIYVTLEQVRELMNDSEAVFIDARPTRAYRGNIETWQRNGHIPGALNIDWHTLTGENNHKFKTVDQMRQIVERLGLEQDDNIIVYCGTSREATLLYHVMKNVLGYDNTRLYEGSWTEYSAFDELPVAKGAQPGGRQPAESR